MRRKKKIAGLLFIFTFLFGIIFNSGAQIVKAEDNAPVLQSSGNVATFVNGRSAVYVDNNISLSGIDNIDGTQIYIGQGFVSTEDSLLFTNQSNITGSYNPATGVLTLTGVDTPANYQKALRSIKYFNSSSTPSTAQRKIVFCIGGKVLYCPPTKHYYEYVPAPAIRWDNAKNAATQKYYYGLQGYLVTITSQDENDFIREKIAGNTWIGASDDTQLGYWTWRTGPEADRCFWNRTEGSQSKVSGDGNNTYGMYNNWYVGEPNNCDNVNERYAHMYSGSGLWNDFKIDNNTIAGYVIEYSENVPVPTLKLTAEVSLNVSLTVSPTITALPQPSGNCISLSWNPNDTSQIYHYMVTKKDVSAGETTEQTIPLKSTANVLNIYPGGGTPISGVIDIDKNTIDTSGNVKQWMQAYGNGKINVDSVYIGNFSSNPDKYLKDEDGNYKYDVVFIGSWDSNNSKDISGTAKTAIQNFINSGGGYLAGHDTADISDKLNLVALAKDNINMICDKTYGLYGGNSGEIGISVVKKGALINYPWELSSSTLTVPASHSTNQFAKGYVWMKYDDNSWGSSLYSDPTGTNNFYLTTWNNAAMIQTGHSNGAASVDEQKILANTLLYLSQVSSQTSFDDHTAQDVTAPSSVSSINANVGPEKKAVISFTEPADNGNIYEYQLKAYGNGDKQVYYSNKTTATITSGIKGYAVVVDKNPDTNPGNIINTTQTEFTSQVLSNGTWYAHVNAIDNAGNVSSTSTKEFTVTASGACDVISWNVPSEPSISDTMVSKTVPYEAKSLILDVQVSPYASWKLYNDTECKNEIADKTMTLKVGENTAYLEVTAENGTVKVYKITLTREADNTPPSVPTLSADITGVTNADVTVTITYSNDSTVKKYSLDGGHVWNDYTGPVVMTANGTVQAKGQDEAGNWSEVGSITVGNIDKDKPSVPTLSADITGVTNADVTVAITYPNDSTVKKYSLDGGHVWNDYTGPVVMTANGTIQAKGQDEAGNWSEVGSITVGNIDKTPPEAPTASTAAGAYNTSQNVTLTAEPGLEIYYTLDGNNPTTGSNHYTEAIKISSDATLKAVAVDQAGNISSVFSAVYKIDTLKPEMPKFILNKSATGEATAAITYSNDSVVKKYSLDGGHTWNNYTVPVVLSANATILAKGQDEAGNWSDIGSIRNIIRDDTPAPVTNTRTVPVVIENTDAEPVPVEITRTNSESGATRDTVIFTEEKAQKTIEQASTTGKSTAAILITEIKGDEAKEVVINIPKESMEQMGDYGIGLDINAEKAVMELPKETMQQLKDREISVQMKEVDQVTEQKSNQLVLQFASGSTIITKPLVIETNFSGRTRVTVPFRNIDLPKNKEELDKFLAGLAVMIQHSDGENVIDKGLIEYDKNGKPTGISIWVEKFSTFTIVGLPAKLADFDGETYSITQKVNMDKEWTIEFSNDTDKGTITNESIFVLDSDGNVHKTKFVISGNSVKVKNVENYKPNQVYYLYINKTIKSNTGKVLTKAVRYKFETTPDKTVDKANKPSVSFVGVEHSPVAAGDTEEFSITAGNAFMVQYNVVLRDSKGKIVEKLTNGYAPAVKANVPFKLKGKYVYKLGTYTLDITVKRVEDGATNSYKAVLNCVKKDDSKTVYANGSMDIEKSSYELGEKIVINGIKGLTGLTGPYVYRLHIYNTEKNEWTKNLIMEYGDKLEWTPTEAGTYVLDVHVNVPNSEVWGKYISNPSSEDIYGTYLAWKLKIITVEDEDMKVVNIK